HRDNAWYRHGRHLPAFGVPLDNEGQPLYRVLFPDTVQPHWPAGLKLELVLLRLARDDQPRKATGMFCALVELSRWTEMTPSADLAAVRAARADKGVMLLGPTLPALPRGERFWGDRLLVPLGYRPEPALPEKAWLEALGVGDEEILVRHTWGVEVMPQAM